METLVAFRASLSCVSPNPGVARSSSAVLHKSMLSNAWIQQQRQSVSQRKLCYQRVKVLRRKHMAIRASTKPSDSGSSEPSVAPLKLETPSGQLILQILVNHPHLVPAAVDQQLEQLQTDREAEQEKEGSTTSGTELVLYRRIAEVKANERKTALEEILYALVVQKFMDASVRLVPALDSLSPVQEDKLEHLHSPEAYEMIQNHLTLVLGNRPGDSNTTANLSKVMISQVYAASVMYGYFLKRVDQRFQLEKSMKILPEGIKNDEYNIQHYIDEGAGDESSSKSSNIPQPHPEMPTWSASSGTSGFGDIKQSRLRTYVMSLDGETLHRYASIRSKEAVSIIEKHTEALFGKSEIAMTSEGGIDSSKDEVMKISLGGLRRLVLEAVSFGSFLWDVESYVDSRYHFVLN